MSEKRPFTEDEIDTIRRTFHLLSNQEIGKLIDRSPDVVSHKGRALGLFKPPELMKKLQQKSAANATAAYMAAYEAKKTAPSGIPEGYRFAGMIHSGKLYRRGRDIVHIGV